MVAAAAGIFYPAATYPFVVGAQKRSGNISHGLLVLANSEALFFGKVTATAVIPYRNRSGERLVVCFFPFIIGPRQTRLGGDDEGKEAAPREISATAAATSKPDQSTHFLC